MEKKFSGCGVAMITPFKSNNEVDFEALDKIIDNFISAKIDYVVLLGTTSEYPCLSSEERLAVVQFAKTKIAGRLPLVLGIGGNNTAEVLKKISETDFSGIDAILTVAPYYNKPNQRGLYAHFSEIAKKCPVDIILYNVPGRTGINILPETILNLAKDFKNIVAVKEASGSVEQIMRIVKDKPEDFMVISGDDALTLPLVSVGVEGVISVAANVFPKEFAEMLHLALAGDYVDAAKIHYKYLDAISMMFEEGNPVGVKYFMSKFGIIKNNLRLPLVSSSQSLMDKIDSFLQKN